MAKDQSMMPFISTYWPHLLVGLFVYVVTYLFFDRSRPSQAKSEAAGLGPDPRKRQENCDNDDAENDDSDDVSDTVLHK